MKKIAMAIGCLLLSAQASAAPAWYFGKITRVWPMSGALVVTLDSGVLDDCLHKYVYFPRAALGEKLYAEIYALALSAMATTNKFGVVIDKQVAGSQCNATSADMRPN
ncbi:hypothetical protein [Pseudomonas sp. YJ42]|uniref:hypothetical protein n=1 Tax=Pseudomonas sp. YJ42 TaxID=3392115 RepID=UPI00399F4615